MSAREEMLNELDLVAVEDDDSTNALTIFDGMSDYAEEDLTAAAQKLLQSDEISDALADIASSLEDEDTILKEQFFGQYSISVVDVSIGDILSASEYQDQFGVLTSRISKILADSDVGLLKTFCMFQPVKLLSYNGRLRVMGGHHRTSTLTWLMHWAGANPQSIMSQVLPCIVFTVDNPLLVGSEKTEEEAALRLVAQFWKTDNGSRSVTKEENSQYKFLKKGVAATSLDDIIESGVMKSSEKLQLVARIVWSDIVEDTRGQASDVVDLSPEIQTGTSLTVQTVSKLMASFYSNLKKIKVAVPYTASNGEETVKEFSKWAKDLEDANSFVKWTETIIAKKAGNKSLLERALISQIRSAGSTNIARDIAKGGAILAQMFDESIAPKYTQKMKTVAKGKKSSLPRRVR